MSASTERAISGADLDSHGKNALSASTSLIVILAVVTLGTVTYLPANLMTFGRFDDYLWAFDNAAGGSSTHVQAWMDSGRPIPAAVAVFLDSIPSSVEDLTLIRILTTAILSLGAAGLGVALLRIRRRTDKRAVILAVVVGGFAISLPAMPSIATWAVLAGSSIAFPAAVAAGLVATKRRTALLPWWVWSGVLVFVAAFSYQHVAPVALLPLLLWSADCWIHRRVWYPSRPIILGGLVLVSLVGNFFYLRLVDSASLDRVDGSTVSERFQWFAFEFLPRTIDLALPWSLRSAAISAVTLILFLSVPLLLGRRYLMLSLAVICCWGFTAVVVLPTELWASYRLVSASQFVLWGGAAIVVAYTITSVRSSLLRNAATVAALAVVVVALLVAGNRAYRYIAVPNALDWASTLCTIREFGPVNDGFTLVLNPYDASGSTVLSYDEYGLIGSSFDWTLPYMVALAEKELDPSLALEDGEPALMPVQPQTEGAAGFVSQQACDSVDPVE